MKMTNQQYQTYVQTLAEPSKMGKDLLISFVVGGLICVLGQGIFAFWDGRVEEDLARMLTSATLIALSALFTGLSLYDNLAKYAGAGTIVPITGFANAVVSSAMEFKAEGFVTGMATKMFIIAGPVIVYGTVASAVYGLIYWVILQL